MNRDRTFANAQRWIREQRARDAAAAAERQARRDRFENWEHKVWIGADEAADEEADVNKREQELIDLLPHGSGIDWSWSCDRSDDEADVWVCANKYHGMVEGGYVSPVDFEVYIRDRGDQFELIRVEADEHDESLPCYADLEDYLEQDVVETFGVRQEQRQ